MRAYIVETAAIRENLEILRKKAGKAELFAVLKGDGYGLGLATMAELCRKEGIHSFAVTEPSDVRRLRQTGQDGEKILMLRPTCNRDELKILLEEGAICTVSCQHDAVVLSGVARELGLRAKVHLKIDTGMGRYGFLPEEKEQLLSCFKSLDCMEICGLYTHFHSAFCNKKKTMAQFEALQAVAAAIREAGYDPGTVHCANSAALLKMPETAMDAVRVGSAILGRVPFRSGLKRVGYCQAALEEVRWLPKGHTCGYGAAWKAKKPTQIAVIPVGWYHGFTTQYGDDVFRVRDQLRKMASGLKGLVFPRRITVTVNGVKCRVLGHVGMLHTVVDITGKNLSAGDTAVLEINPCRVRGMEIRFV